MDAINKDHGSLLSGPLKSTIICHQPFGARESPYLRLGRGCSDLANETYVTAVLEMLKRRIAEGYRLFIWCSLPCVSANGERSADGDGEAIKESYVDKLLALFLYALRSLPKEFVVTAFVWPRSASAWKKPSQTFIQLRLALPLTFDFDGCRYGWNAKKPLRVITDFSSLKEVLSLRCGGGSGHEHISHGGRLVEDVGCCTFLFAEMVADAVCDAVSTSIVAPVDQVPDENVQDPSSMPSTSTTLPGNSEVPGGQPLE